MPVTVPEFTVEHVDGPNGEKMMRLNGVVYPYEEGEQVLKGLQEAFFFGLEESDLCPLCNVSPCIVWGEQGNDIGAMAERMQEEGKPNNEIRFACYKAFTAALEGHLGKENRKRLPHCVVVSVRGDYPVLDGDKDYVGYKESK